MKMNVDHLIGKEIQFTPGIEEFECYPEGGMRARIAKIETRDIDKSDLHEHLYLIYFDYTEYDEFNKRFETANYYGDDYVANKTAREVGHYKTVDEIYFGSPEIWPFENYFNVLNDKAAALVKMFKESGAENYVYWLESMVDIS
jgi:hypothetical protein